MAGINAYRKETVDQFFDTYESLMRQFNFLLNRIYDLDETTLCTNESVQIVAPKG